MSISKTLARKLGVWEFAIKKKKKERKKEVNLSELILFRIVCLKN